LPAPPSFKRHRISLIPTRALGSLRRPLHSQLCFATTTSSPLFRLLRSHQYTYHYCHIIDDYETQNTPF
jgi:hypothetical protein